MRLILEKAEIVAVLSKHFDAELDPDNVIIRTEPFEIEVCGLPLGSSDPPPKYEVEDNVTPLRMRPPEAPKEQRNNNGPAKKRADEGATEDPPEPGLDGVETSNAGDVHPAAVLAASKELEKELDRENPQLAKRRSGNYTLTPPPYEEEG